MINEESELKDMEVRIFKSEPNEFKKSIWR
jgi:hypothetical protein